MAKPLSSWKANDSQQVVPAGERQCSSVGFTPWPAATAGVHPRIHSRSHFPYLTPCLYLSPHFALISLHLCVCLIFRRCYIKHLSPVTPVQQFACRLISANVINYYIVQTFSFWWRKKSVLASVRCLLLK